MKEKQTGSYILWSLYTIVIGGLFLLSTYRYVVILDLNIAASAGITAGAVFVLVGLTILFSKLFAKRQCSNFIFYGFLCFVFFLIAVVGGRILDSVIGGGHLEAFGNWDLFENAKVSQDFRVSVTFFENPIRYLYEISLHAFAKIFGNTGEAALECGYVFFSVEALLTYVVFYVYGGALCALVGGSLFFSFADSLHWYGCISDLHMGLVLFLVLLLLHGILKRKFSHADSAGYMGGLVIIGIVSGVFVYYSILFVLPMLLTIFNIFMLRREDAAISRFMLFLLFLLASLVGFFGMTFLHSVIEKLVFVGLLQDMGETIQSMFAGLSFPRFLEEVGFGTMISAAFAFLFVGFYFRRKKVRAVYAPMFLTAILIGLIHFCDTKELGILYRLFLCLTAGAAFESLFTEPEKKLVEETAEKDAFAQIEKMEQQEEASVTKEPEVPIQQELPAKPEEPVQQEMPAPGQPLFNPLPEPKKHVKKTMKFDHSVSAEDMHYDVEVSENDDYDL